MKYRNSLPQVNGTFCLTDGGLETDLIFNRGIDLPHFSSLMMFAREDGPAVMEDYLKLYVGIAREHGYGLIMVANTWRGSMDWAEPLGLDQHGLAEYNARALHWLHAFREKKETPGTPLVVAGCFGPRGDGYAPGEQMSVPEATHYHDFQANIFAQKEVDYVSALTLNYVEEAAGIAKACRDHALPVDISFTVETDGRLPGGEPLAEAIERCDELTNGYPLYYMINCAHPTHFRHLFEEGGEWVNRVRGVRANASCKSHAELDESTELDIGDPADYGRQMAELLEMLPHICVLGGCCGTDHRHIGETARSMQAATAA